MDRPALLMLTAAVVLQVLIHTAAAASDDPCDPVNHNELDEPHRSVSYKTADWEKPLCDRRLPEGSGWYRSTSLAGGTMPVACPDLRSCGTVMPIWMNGTHPSVEDGAQQRAACVHYQDNTQSSCCKHSTTIVVKNCGRFYVYYLHNTIGCPMAYCFGDKEPCPAGKWSETGFSPCLDAYPVLTTPPTLSGPITDDNGKCFHLKCTIHSQHQNKDQRFEVKWTFDTFDANHTEVIKDPTREAILPGHLLKGHVNSYVRCHVRAFYVGKEDHKGDFLNSYPYYAVIDVTPEGATTGPLMVGEIDVKKNILVSSTIPILCDDLTASCCLEFSLDINKKSEISIETNCTWNLCKKHWDAKTNTATIQVPVVANQDLKDDGNKQLKLSFDKLTSSAGGGQCMDIFRDHIPEALAVEKIDAKATTCTLKTDPHIKTFDKVNIGMFLLGDFTICNITDKNFDVQIRNWACGYKTCICGVTVREDNDIVRIDMCDQEYNGKYTAPKINFGRGKYRESTVVQRSGDGWTIGVLLPSGSQLKVTANPMWLNLELKLSGRYFGQCRGICGTNDGTHDNELTYPNGTVGNLIRRDDFFKAWRVNETKSRFEHLPPDVSFTFDDVRYCGCTDNMQGNVAVNCTIRGNVATPEGLPPPCLGCGKCSEVNPFCLGGDPWKRHKRSTFGNYVDEDVEDYPHDVFRRNARVVPAPHTLQWPADDGTTESEARAKCKGEMEKSQLYAACKFRGRIVDDITADCIEDIHAVGSKYVLPSIKDIFTSTCQLELSMDPASLVSTPDGKTVMKPEYSSDICISGCELHGQCVAGGKCVCDQGWGGDQCHIHTDSGPELGKIRSGPLCDLLQKPCRKVYMDVTNMDMTESLSCRVQTVEVDGNQGSSVVITKATAMTSHRVACDIPEHDYPSQAYLISVSNDGVSKFGNSVFLRVFDSSCRDCTVDGCLDRGTVCRMATTTSSSTTTTTATTKSAIKSTTTVASTKETLISILYRHIENLISLFCLKDRL